MASHTRTLKGTGDITVGQALGVLKKLAKTRLKLGVLPLIASAIIGYTTAVFTIGQQVQATSTAITLGRPFGMVLEVGSKKVRFPFPELILTRDFNVPDATDGTRRVVFRLRTLNESEEVYSEIGHVDTQAANSSMWDWLPLTSDSFDLVGRAYAQERFDWHGHKGNFSFQEKFVRANTIRRYYDDGWVMEYKVDNKGRALPETRRWVSRG